MNEKITYQKGDSWNLYVFGFFLEPIYTYTCITEAFKGVNSIVADNRDGLWYQDSKQVRDASWLMEMGMFLNHCGYKLMAMMLAFQ